MSITLLLPWLIWHCTATLPKEGPVSQGTYRKKLDISLMGAKRSYLLHVPGSVKADQPLPLVIVLHGAFGTGKTIEKESGFSMISDREGFLVAYPEGGYGLFGLFQHWNAGHCCGKAQNDKTDDVGFLESVIKDIRDRFPVDPARIYMVGFSNGGMMTYRFAAEKTNLLAGAAPMAASAGGKASNKDSLWVIPKPKNKLPLIIFHALDDPNVPFEGGQSPKKGGEREYISVQQSVEIWIKNNGCKEIADIDTLFEDRVIRSEWCEGSENEIDLYTIKNWGHKWPGKYYTNKLKSDDSFRGFDAAEIIWKFFKQHKK